MIKIKKTIPPGFTGKKRSPRAVAAAIVFMLCVATSTFSIIFADGGRPGEIFLSGGAGARYLALGGSGVATNIVDGFSPYYNSGALGFIERKEIATLYSILWEETSYNYLSYVHPIYSGGCLGVEFARLYSGGAIKTDENNNVVGDFYNQQISMGIGYGKTVTEKLSAGFKMKFFNNFLDQISASNFIVDGGAIYRVNESLSMGVALQNLIAMNLNDSSDTMPFIIKSGLCYNIFGERLSAAFDFYSGSGVSGTQQAYSIGIESRLNNHFALRLGKSRQEEITAGMGISLGGFSLDYAMGMHYLGLSHRASFNFRFGKSRKEMEELARKAESATKVIETTELTTSTTTPEDDQRIMAFQENYQGAINMYKRGLFTIALDRFKNAANLDPTDPDVPLYIERLNMITPIVPQNMAQDKVSELMRRGIVYFIEGHGQSAVKTLAYALSLEPDNFTLMRLLGRVEEKTGYRVDRSQPASGLTLVDKMQYESLIAFKKKDYAETIKLCEDILLLEPDNALALKRIGSAFYALGETEKAKKMWQRSNEISYDKKLDELIKKIK